MVNLEELSKAELIEQLKLCWKHFSVCLSALNGHSDVQPVKLLDSEELGDSDDLELFYACLKKGAKDEE